MGAGNPATKAVITLSVTGTLGSVPGSRWYRRNQISLSEFLVSLIKQFRNGSKWKLKDSFISFLKSSQALRQANCTLQQLPGGGEWRQSIYFKVSFKLAWSPGIWWTSGRTAGREASDKGKAPNVGETRRVKEACPGRRKRESYTFWIIQKSGRLLKLRCSLIEWGFWEGDVQFLIKGQIIPPFCLAE